MTYGRGTIRQKTVDQISYFLEQMEKIPAGECLVFVGLPDPHLTRHRIYKYLNAMNQKFYYQLHITNPPEIALKIYKIGPPTDKITTLRYGLSGIGQSIKPDPDTLPQLNPKLKEIFYSWPKGNPLSELDFPQQVELLYPEVKEGRLSEEEVLEILNYDKEIKDMVRRAESSRSKESWPSSSSNRSEGFDKADSFLRQFEPSKRDSRKDKDDEDDEYHPRPVILDQPPENKSPEELQELIDKAETAPYPDVERQTADWVRDNKLTQEDRIKILEARVNKK